MPAVSILMPVWNNEQNLREAIESVRAQTMSSWELLLIDDGSEDSSLRIALDCAEADPDRIRILRHPGGENRGSSASRNLGLRHARGELLAFLDADDVWLPDCLALQMWEMTQRPEAAMVFGAAERWCNPDEPFNEAKARRADWGDNYIPPVVPAGEFLGVLPLGSLLEWYLEDESKVPCICSVLLRTAVARAVGGFDEAFRGLYDDQAFHAKVSLAYPVVAHDACVARYRQHAGSCCAEARADDALQEQGRAAFLTWLARYRRMLVRSLPPLTVEQPQA
ncbi:glycosyltransferase family 2 protein [Terriglobus aquaticus]|uniref:glycosyltransferase family 2 protein n=1 Tax=Terriglobus aquaticus TaxID=940139 RepID=UPI0021DFE23F|nr:glycosyltransferase family 2 protein [Terriglobus aquaticus]